jgi:hypothetical protein
LSTQFLEREMAETGLGVAQLGLMAQIAAMSDDTLSALAQRTGLEQSTLSQSAGGRGAGRIAIAGDDLRRRMVWLTETGARRLEAAIPSGAKLTPSSRAVSRRTSPGG